MFRSGSDVRRTAALRRAPCEDLTVRPPPAVPRPAPGRRRTGPVVPACMLCRSVRGSPRGPSRCGRVSSRFSFLFRGVLSPTAPIPVSGGLM
ncbi:unnamed protein product [Arctogadus glacialis]